MTYAEYCRRRQALADAYARAQVASEHALRSGDMIGVCAAVKRMDAAHLASDRLQGEMIRGAVVLPAAPADT